MRRRVRRRKGGLAVEREVLRRQAGRHPDLVDAVGRDPVGRRAGQLREGAGGEALVLLAAPAVGTIDVAAPIDLQPADDLLHLGARQGRRRLRLGGRVGELRVAVDGHRLIAQDQILALHFQLGVDGPRRVEQVVVAGEDVRVEGDGKPAQRDFTLGLAQVVVVLGRAHRHHRLPADLDLGAVLEVLHPARQHRMIFQVRDARRPRGDEVGILLLLLGRQVEGDLLLAVLDRPAEDLDRALQKRDALLLAVVRAEDDALSRDARLRLEEGAGSCDLELAFVPPGELLDHRSLLHLHLQGEARVGDDFVPVEGLVAGRVAGSERGGRGGLVGHLHQLAFVADHRGIDRDLEVLADHVLDLDDDLALRVGLAGEDDGAVGLDGDLHRRQRTLGVADDDDHVLAGVGAVLGVGAVGLLGVVVVMLDAHLRHHPQRRHRMDEDRLAVGGEVVGLGQFVPEEEGFSALDEVAALGLGVRLVAVLPGQLVEIELEVHQPLHRLVAAAPALRRRAVEVAQLAGLDDPLEVLLADPLLLRIDRLDERGGVLLGAVLFRGEIEIRDLGRLVGGELGLAQRAGGEDRVLGEDRPVQRRRAEVPARPPHRLARLDRVLMALAVVALERVEHGHFSVAQVLHGRAVLAGLLEIEVRPGRELLHFQPAAVGAERAHPLALELDVALVVGDQLFVLLVDAGLELVVGGDVGGGELAPVGVLPGGLRLHHPPLGLLGGRALLLHGVDEQPLEPASVGGVGVERLALEVKIERVYVLVALDLVAQEHEAGVAPGVIARPRAQPRRHHFAVGHGHDRRVGRGGEVRARVEHAAVAQGEEAAQAALGLVVERGEGRARDQVRAVDEERKPRDAGERRAGRFRTRGFGVVLGGGVLLRRGAVLLAGGLAQPLADLVHQLVVVLHRRVGQGVEEVPALGVGVGEEPLAGLARMRLQEPRGLEPVLRELLAGRLGPRDHPEVARAEQILLRIIRIDDAQPELAAVAVLLVAGDDHDVAAVLGEQRVLDHRVVLLQLLEVPGEPLLHRGAVGVDVRVLRQLARVGLPAGRREDAGGIHLAVFVDARELALVRSAQEAEVELRRVEPRARLAVVVADVLIGLALRLGEVVVDHGRGGAAAPEAAAHFGGLLLEAGDVEPAALQSFQVGRLHVRGLADGVVALDAGHAGAPPPAGNRGLARARQAQRNGCHSLPDFVAA